MDKTKPDLTNCFRMIPPWTRPGDEKGTEKGDICSECWGMGRVIPLAPIQFSEWCKKVSTISCDHCDGTGIEPERINAFIPVSAADLVWMEALGMDEEHK
jgi:hypothetical protein